MSDMGGIGPVPVMLRISWIFGFISGPYKFPTTGNYVRGRGSEIYLRSAREVRELPRHDPADSAGAAGKGCFVNDHAVGF